MMTERTTITAWCVVLVCLLLCCGGRATSDVPGERKKNEPGVCTEGELRQGDLTCEGEGSFLEICSAGEWVPMEKECFQGMACEEGDISYGDAIGDYSFNVTLLECKEGVMQVTGVACGTVEPIEPRRMSTHEIPELPLPDEVEREELVGITFPSDLGFGWERTLTDLSHVLCAETIWTTGIYPELRNLFAVEHLRINGAGQMEQFGALRSIGYLDVDSKYGGLEPTNDNDFRALGPLEEVRNLHMSNTQVRTLDGLEYVTHMSYIGIYDNKELVSLRGLSGLRTVEGDFGVYGELAEGFRLTGLEQLTSVGGSLTLPIRHEGDFQVLAQLESVGGGLSLWMLSTELSCAAVEFVSGVTVGGNVNLYYGPPGNTTIPECQLGGA